MADNNPHGKLKFKIKLEWYVHGCIGEIELIEGVNFIIDTVTNTIIITANIPGTLPAPCNNYNFVLTQGTTIMLDPPYNEREAQWGWGGYRQHNKSNSYGTNQPRALTLLMNGQPATVQITQMNTKMTYSNPEFLPKLAEWHIYGNEQQGRFLTKYPEELNPTYYGTEVTDDIKDNKFKRQLGKKAYELKDHLGNVRVTHSDIKMPTGTPAQPFRVDLLSKSEYYPGGMPILDLSYQLENKRYGYNSGAEVDREIFSQKDRAFSTLFREGDTYTLRWWSQDPKRNELPHQSTYSYMDANPISKNDPDGDLAPAVSGAIVGGFSEYLSIIADRMISDKMTFIEANKSLDWGDASDISIATLSGAATGSADGGISQLISKLKSPMFRKAITKLLEAGTEVIEEFLKSKAKGEEMDKAEVATGLLLKETIGKLVRIINGTDVLGKQLDNITDNVKIKEAKIKDLENRTTNNTKGNKRKVENTKKEVKNDKSDKNVVETIKTGGEVVEKTTTKTTNKVIHNDSKTKK